MRSTLLLNALPEVTRKYFFLAVTSCDSFQHPAKRVERLGQGVGETFTALRAVLFGQPSDV